MYESCYVYDLSGNQLGWIIRKAGTLGIRGTNIYDNPQELDDQLERLNNDAKIKGHWPSLLDPDVQALIQDPQWEPLEYMEDEVMDETKSSFVYTEDGDINWSESNIVYKTITVPADSNKAAERTKKAMEIIATKRAEL